MNKIIESSIPIVAIIVLGFDFEFDSEQIFKAGRTESFAHSVFGVPVVGKYEYETDLFLIKFSIDFSSEVKSNILILKDIFIAYVIAIRIIGNNISKTVEHGFLFKISKFFLIILLISKNYL